MALSLPALMLPIAGGSVLNAEHDVTAEQVVGERPGALIGDDGDVGAGHALELLGAEIIQRRRRRRADRERARLLLGERDDVGHGLHRHRRIGHDHDRDRGDQPDRREVLLQIVAGIGRQAGAGHQHQDRVAVGRGLGAVAHADHRAGARAVDHDDLFAERVGEFLRDDAADGVDAAAGRIRHDQLHDAVGIIVGRRRLQLKADYRRGHADENRKAFDRSLFVARISSSTFFVHLASVWQVSPCFGTGLRGHGCASAIAIAAAMNGSGTDTAARSHTRRGGIIGTSQITSRWIA